MLTPQSAENPVELELAWIGGPFDQRLEHPADLVASVLAPGVHEKKHERVDVAAIDQLTQRLKCGALGRLAFFSGQLEQRRQGRRVRPCTERANQFHLDCGRGSPKG